MLAFSPCRVLCDLPAEYLFTDVIKQPPVFSDLGNSADCLLSIHALVNSILEMCHVVDTEALQSNNSGAFVLPADFTFHITKVIVIS